MAKYYYRHSHIEGRVLNNCCPINTVIQLASEGLRTQDSGLRTLSKLRSSVVDTKFGGKKKHVNDLESYLYTLIIKACQRSINSNKSRLKENLKNAI